MKKYYFMMAAVSAMMLTACSSEDDVLLADKAQPTVENSAVGFDVYTPAAATQTRAGRVNVMTNGTLQQTGFGVYGYQSNDKNAFDVAGYATGDLPNFMWNQQIFFNKTASGWYYAPLKYWPNETINDSQTTPTTAAGMPDQGTTNPKQLDRLSFFAYAPWVKLNAGTGAAEIVNSTVEAPATTAGIVGATNNQSKYGTSSGEDPTVRYIMATDPNNSVDLLWGVAPTGGLSYTNVAGKTNSIAEGMPLVDLVKPAVNTNMKFLFQHALARLGVKVVAAVDQVAAGGIFDYGNTKITIEKIEIKGQFGNSGELNLKNTQPNVPNWKITSAATGENSDNPVLTIEAGKGLAPHLVYDGSKNTNTTHQQQLVTGVTTTLADAIKVSSTLSETNYKYAKEVTTPAYSPTTPLFSTEAGNNSNAYVAYAPQAGHYSASADSIYFHKHTTNNAYTNNEAYTVIRSADGTSINDLKLTYPNATVWENIYAIKTSDFIQVDGTTVTKANAVGKIAYREVADGSRKHITYVPTGQDAEVGDYYVESANKFVESTLGTTGTDYYTAVPNYFMFIPTNHITGYDTDDKYRTLNVKITYYVSTIDPNVKDGIVYTKNEVEKDIVLPHLKNGIAYNLKLILGLTSVKLEAEISDWTTTNAEVNLPQNTAE